MATTNTGRKKKGSRGRREGGKGGRSFDDKQQDDRQQRSEGVGPSGTGLGWAGLAGIMNAWMKSANEPETQRRGAAAARPIVIGDRVKRAYCWCCGLRTLRRRHRITPIRAWRHGASLRLPGLARRRRMTRKHSLPAEAGAGISHSMRITVRSRLYADRMEFSSCSQRARQTCPGSQQADYVVLYGAPYLGPFLPNLRD